MWLCGFARSADISYLVVMFAKQLHQADISFIMCACPPIFMRQFSSHWTDFEEILYWMLLLKSAYKIQVSLNLHTITDITNICLLSLLNGTQGMAWKVEYSAVNVDGTLSLHSACVGATDLLHSACVGGTVLLWSAVVDGTG